MPSHGDYTVGWVCALPREMAAAKAMLDRPHPPLSQPPSDSNSYTLGEIAGRNVVLACLPAGVYGTVSAASVVTQMRSTYPAIQFGLMVGIGGRVPSEKNDIRLGDVVVSRPTGSLGGVIQYDFGKSVSGGRFERTGTLNKPPTVLLTAMANLESQHLLEGDRFTDLLAELVLKHPSLDDFTRRGRNDRNDQLFQAEYDHPKSQDTCKSCNLSNVVPRRNRNSDGPVIHYGLVASGDQVMKDGRMRDNLAKEINILCFEMEAAGLMDSLPCLVIRGICDYSDSHKNKEWQNYAAVVAAMYARELLKVTPTQGSMEFPPCPQETRSPEQMEALMKAIPRADGATFDSRANEHASRCLPNTRVDILNRIMDWSASVESKPIFWLSGMAGTGKTTIALTIAQKMREARRLAASFFFSRGGGSRGHAGRLFTSLAYGLANASSELKTLICDAMEENEDFAALSLREQWKHLILQPISKFSKRYDRLGQLIFVIVIDALDECDEDEDIEIFLDCIKEIKFLGKLDLRFLITSRPEVPIRYGFEIMPEDSHQDFDIFEIDSSITRNDISTFIAYNLGRIGKRRMLPRTWPGKQAVEVLAERADSLFIYAATVCRFIEGSLTPSKTLNDLLQDTTNQRSTKSPYGALDQIYTTALLQVLDKMSPDGDDYDGNNVLLRVIGSIVLLQMPISRAALSQLLCIDLESITSILSLLQSVLQVPDNNHDPVRLLHPSLRDFLLDPKRCTMDKLQISKCILHGHIAKSCINSMSAKLHRDMCQLRLPGACTSDVLQLTIDGLLSEEVQYACIYWARHLYETKVDYQGCKEVLLFLTEHFLHWLECLSMMKEISIAVDSLNLIRDLAKALNATHLSHFLIDADRFLLTNRYIIERAALQLYSSALIFSPSTSVIRELFWHEVPFWLTRFPSVPERWSHCLHVLEPTSRSLDLLKFSPESRSLFYGTESWDSTTGASLNTLWDNGLTTATTAVCFSSDGRLAASASPDVHVWDTKIGTNIQTIGDDLEEVTALCFSQDGQVIATALNDHTIRLWNVSNGQHVHILRGHIWHISSMAFVPGHDLLASQSLDWSICVWDVVTGSLVWHLQDCFSSNPQGKITISSNGGYLVSFFDNAVHIWDIETRDRHLLLEQLEVVRMVIFSRNNELVAVGCSHGTVQIWNVASGANIHTFEGYRSQVTALAFHPNGNKIASGHQNGRVQLWSLSGDSRLLVLTGHTQFLEELVFSTDGKLLASAACDNTVRLWDIEESTVRLDSPMNPKNAPTWWPGEMIQSWVHSPDGKLVATRDSNGKIEVWDSTTGMVLYDVDDHISEPGPLEFSPDTTVLAYGAGSTVGLWDLARRQKIATLDVEIWPRHLAFTQDGKEIVVANEKLEIWSLEERARTRILHDYSINARAFCFSADSSFMALPYIEHSVGLWDLSLGKLICRLVGHSGDINDLVFSPNSKLLASASSDTTIRIWDTVTRKHSHTLSGHVGKVITVLFSPNGALLASGSTDGGIGLWDPKKGCVYWSLNGHQKDITCLQFSPHRKWLASASLDKCVRLWNPINGKCLATLRGHSGPITVLTCSPDGTLLASGSSDHTIRLWDPETGTLLSLLSQHQGGIQALEFSPDGMLLASGSLDQTAKLWEPLTMAHIRTIDDDLGHITSVHFSPDGRVLAIGSADKYARLWDPNSGDLVRRLVSEGTEALKFFPNGEVIACLELSKLIILQDATRGTYRGFIHCALIQVNRMAFSAVDHTAAFASTDEIIRLWNIASGKAMGNLEGHSSLISGLAFSPDGSLLASASMDHTVRLWSVESLASIATFRFSSFVFQISFICGGSALRSNQGVIDISHLVSPPQASRDFSQLYGVSDETHWLRWMDHDVLWLPADYRRGWRIHDNVLTIPSPSGGLSFMEFSRHIRPIPLEPAGLLS